MLDDLRRVRAPTEWPRGELSVARGGEIRVPWTRRWRSRGKIDRLDVAPTARAYVIDYKYSGAQSTRAPLNNENLLQAPLYLMAARAALRR